jgi:hypothetical protein
MSTLGYDDDLDRAEYRAGVGHYENTPDHCDYCGKPVEDDDTCPECGACPDCCECCGDEEEDDNYE